MDVRTKALPCDIRLVCSMVWCIAVLLRPCAVLPVYLGFALRCALCTRCSALVQVVVGHVVAALLQLSTM